MISQQSQVYQENPVAYTISRDFAHSLPTGSSDESQKRSINGQMPAPSFFCPSLILCWFSLVPSFLQHSLRDALQAGKVCSVSTCASTGGFSPLTGGISSSTRGMTGGISSLTWGFSSPTWGIRFICLPRPARRKSPRHPLLRRILQYLSRWM